MRIRRTMFSLSPLLRTNLAPPGISFEIAGAGQYRTSITNDHLDFPELGGFGKAFQDAAGEFLGDSRQPGPRADLAPIDQGSPR
jgi:hypothetical protein